MANPNVSRRQMLRTATDAAHRRLDEAVGDFTDLARYRRYLAGAARFRLAFEPRVAASPGAARFALQPLSALIRADLDDLGLPAPETSDGPALAGGQAPGAAYVLVGSNLGAVFLFERAKALGLGAAHGARHLAEQAAAAREWKAFVQRLEAAEPFDIEEAIEGARLTFDAALEAFAGVSDGE